jgi:hypothetical protein
MIYFIFFLIYNIRHQNPPFFKEYELSVDFGLLKK